MQSPRGNPHPFLAGARAVGKLSRKRCFASRLCAVVEPKQCLQFELPAPTRCPGGDHTFAGRLTDRHGQTEFEGTSFSGQRVPQASMQG